MSVDCAVRRGIAVKRVKTQASENWLAPGLDQHPMAECAVINLELLDAVSSLPQDDHAAGDLKEGLVDVQPSVISNHQVAQTLTQRIAIVSLVAH